MRRGGGSNCARSKTAIFGWFERFGGGIRPPFSFSGPVNEAGLSGDADYLPPVAAVKNRGKLVCCVSFLDRKGRQLPGGARRLSNAVDSRTDLHFELVRRAMRIEEVLTDMPIAV